MPVHKQPPPRRIKTGTRLASTESYLYSPNVLAHNNPFHALDYDTKQLPALEEMLLDPNFSDKEVLIPEILKRLKGHELSTLITKLQSLGTNTLLQQTYLVALIERINRMRDDVLFDPAAAHWRVFNASKDESAIPYQPHCAYLALKQRLQKNPALYQKLKPSPSNEIMKSMQSSTRTNEISLTEIKKMVPVPEIVQHSSACFLAADISNTLYWVAWNAYYYTIGWFTYPLYLLGMATIDQVRIFTIRCTQWSLTTHPLLKLPITAIGSGTALVGILTALSSFGVPVIPGAALGSTGLLIAGVVNLLASADLKDKKLSPIVLSKVFMVCCFAAAASAMMAQVGIQKILLEFKFGKTPPADAILVGRDYDAAFWSGIILAGFNFFTSIRSTYGASARYLSDYSDPLSPYNLAKGKSLTKAAAIYLFTLITLSVALVYSVSITEKLTGEKFAQSVKSSTPVLAAICATNLTTAAIFINRTIDWIYEMFNEDLNGDPMKCGISGAKEWIAMLGGMFMIGSFYLISAFGNATGSAETLWDNDLWERSLGGLMSLAIFPSVWQTIKKMVRTIEQSPCCAGSTSTRNSDERAPLLMTAALNDSLA
ncbi:MAG: hypothetical protein EXR81_05785 [Gammaproteobacteria bacterium]|nr:hypothetical protein [Gammaproteobacteria bacterium]